MTQEIVPLFGCAGWPGPGPTISWHVVDQDDVLFSDFFHALEKSVEGGGVNLAQSAGTCPGLRAAREEMHPCARVATFTNSLSDLVQESCLAARNGPMDMGHALERETYVPIIEGRSRP